MAISKTENETYRLRLYYPQDIQEMIGVNKLYSKTFKTRKEAKAAEIDFYAKINAQNWEFSRRINQDKKNFPAETTRLGRKIQTSSILDSIIKKILVLQFL